MTRRDVLRAGLAGTAASLAPLGCAPRPAPTPVDPGTDFVAALLTDMHVDANNDSAPGFAQALRKMMDRPQQPEMLITGGDLAMDILATSEEEADAQYALFEDQLSAIDIPVHHTMGNHDMLGVFPDSGVDPADPKYGKQYFRDRFGNGSTYQSFDWEGWHFVILDSLGIRDRAYIGHIDAEQLAWLDDDLAASGKPTVVTTHVPLVSNYIEMQRGTEEGIPGGISVTNVHEVVPILEKHPVKLVLTGHLHINESFRYNGIEYATVGAVSGNWWKGARNGFEEGFALLEFRGQDVSWRYVDYGWEVEEETLTEAS
ncbi:MAG: metallophosphoesterase [Acidobacteriota bacterium]|nr:metallophosphoesterase [Acidobacteriota bacterium]